MPKNGMVSFRPVQCALLGTKDLLIYQVYSFTDGYLSIGEKRDHYAHI